MSGYRSLHRERIDAVGGAVWSVASSPLLRTQQQMTRKPLGDDSSGSNPFRVWVTGSADGLVRGYVVEETSLQSDGKARGAAGLSPPPLDASAAKLSLTHVLEPRDDPGTGPSIGCSRVCTTRNYVGQDTAAGNLIVVSLDLVGTLRVWELDPNMDADYASTTSPTSTQQEPLPSPTRIRARCEHRLIDACGTSLALQRPAAEGPVTVAVGMLDGTVVLVSTGLTTPKYAETKSPPPSGTILDTRGSKGSSVALCLCWKPTPTSSSADETLAVGRQDGTVDLISTTSRSHRLVRHSSPVRAITYTPDGALLMTGSDQGMVCIWDTSRPSHVALVHHLQMNSWVLHITALEDSRRFATCNQNSTISVWNLDHASQVSHTFTTEHAVHACCTVEGRPRIVAGNEGGWLQLYAIE